MQRQYLRLGRLGSLTRIRLAALGWMYHLLLENMGKMSRPVGYDALLDN